MTTNNQDIIGSYVVVRHPSLLRKPYNEKVIERVGRVESAILPKAGTRANSIAKVRFPGKRIGGVFHRSFSAAVNISNLTVVPKDFDPRTSRNSSSDAATSTKNGPSWDQIRQIEHDRDLVRREADALRKQVNDLTVQMGLLSLHRQGNITLWRGNGTDQPATLDGNMAVLIRADELAALVAKSRTMASGIGSDGTSSGKSSSAAGRTPGAAIDPLTDSTPERASLRSIARMITTRFRQEDDNYVTSIGNWEPDPLQPGLDQFCAIFSIPMADWRAYAGAEALPEAKPMEIPLIKVGMTVRIKDPSKLQVKLGRRVAGRIAEVKSVDASPADRGGPRAVVRFYRREGRGKRFEESFLLEDLAIVPGKLTD